MPDGVARNVIETATGLDRLVAKFVVSFMTDSEIAQLASPHPVPELDVARRFAADALVRAADQIRPSTPAE